MSDVEPELKSKGSFSFVVRGVPVPQGSKKAFVLPNTKRAVIVDQAGGRLKDWRRTLVSVALEHAPEALLEGPIAVSLFFFFLRPKSTKRIHHTIRPDADKLARAVLDALTGVYYRDDAQITHLRVAKEYGEIPGCHVTVDEIEE